MKYIISLGGSIINPGTVDVTFLRGFRRLILEKLKAGHQFFIVTGGGQLTRSYQTAVRKIVKPGAPDLDWLGIATTKANAELVRVIFGKIASPVVLSNPSKKTSGLKGITIFSGWKPGWSTDYDAVKLAQTYKAKVVINLSNVDYVYDRDPRKNKKARRCERMTWRQFQRQFGIKWSPGAHVPFDPVAAKLAHKLGLKVVVLNGRKLQNFQNFLRGRSFKATIIM